MNKQFTVELDDQQFEYLNTILPQNHSLQLHQKLERRRKAQKKLDNMYVAQFSLRPVKKIKKENQIIPQKNSKNTPQQQKLMFKETLAVNNDIKNTYSMIKSVHQQIDRKYQNQKQKMEINKQTEISLPKGSRSQRVSRPTSAYLQFQQETFKRKGETKLNTNTPKHVQIQESNQKIKDAVHKGIEHNGGKLSNQQWTYIQKGKKQLYNYQNEQKQRQGFNLKQKQDSIVKQKQRVILKQKQLIIEKPYSLRKAPIKKQFFENIQTQKQHRRLVIQAQNIPAFQFKQVLQKKLNQSSEQLVSNSNFQNPLSSEEMKFGRIIQVSHQENKIFNKCWLLLSKLKNHKYSWPFRHPVDPIAQGVPDYLQKIKNPMDLKTIQKKLRSQKYHTEQDFHSDIKLMLSNSQSYNPQQSKYYKLTKQLQKYYKQIKSDEKKLNKKKSNKQEQQNYDQDQFSQEQQQNKINKNLDYQQKSQKNSKSLNNENLSKSINNQKYSKYINTQKIRENRTSKKRNYSQLSNQQPIQQLKQKNPSKIILRSTGPTRKQNQNYYVDQSQKMVKQKYQNQQNKKSAANQIKLNIKKLQMTDQKVENMNLSGKKQRKNVQKLQQTNKKIEIQQQSNKKQELQKENGLISNNKCKPLRFGYFQPKITVTQRQILLYDIYHLKNQQSKKQLQNYLIENQQTYKKYMYWQQEQNNKQNQKSNNQGNDQKDKVDPANKIEQQKSGYLQIQLKDMDQQTYQKLRGQVNKLMLLSSEQQQTVKLGQY